MHKAESLFTAAHHGAGKFARILLAVFVLLGALTINENVPKANAAPIVQNPGISDGLNSTMGMPQYQLLNPITHKLYVFGQVGGTNNQAESIAVIDTTANKVVAHMSTGQNFVGLSPYKFLNQKLNKIYDFEVNAIYVIDGNTDTIERTVIVPGLGSAAYDQTNNKIYTVQYFTDPNQINRQRGKIVALDADTLQPVDTIAPDTATGMDSAPGNLQFNPANNKLYVWYTDHMATAFALQIIDTTTDTTIKEASCDTTACNLSSLIFVGNNHINVQSLIKQSDNSLWILADVTQAGTPTGQEGHGGGIIGATGPEVVFYRLDGVTDTVTDWYLVASDYAAMTQMDQSNGRIYLKDFFNGDTQLMRFDPANPETITWVQPANFTSSQCGSVNNGFPAMEVDFDLGYIYWACQPTAGNASVLVGKISDIDNVNNVVPPSSTSVYPISFVTPFAEIKTDVSQPLDVNTILNDGNHQLYVNSTSPFMSDNQAKTVFIDPVNMAAHSVAFKNDVFHIAYNSADNTVVMVDGLHVITVNAATHAVISSVPKTEPGTFVAINPITDSPVISVGPVAVNNVTNIEYNTDGSTLTATDLATGTKTFTATDFGTGTDTCTFTDIAVNQALNQFVVSGNCQAAGPTLAVYDGATNTIVNKISVGASFASIDSVAVNPATNKIYTAMTGLGITAAKTLEIYDGATLTHIASLQNTEGPLAVMSGRNLIFTQISSTVGAEEVDGNTNLPLSPMFDFMPITSFAVDNANNTVYVGNFSNNILDKSIQPDLGFVQIFKEITKISGQLTDSTGQGIAGVSVSISGGPTTATVTTDANGNYTFPDVFPGSYTVAYGTTTPALFPIGSNSQAITVTNQNISGINFQALTTPIVITGNTAFQSVPNFTDLNFGAGQNVSYVIKINQPAPAGGITVNLVSTDAGAVKVPATAVIPAGQNLIQVTGKTSGVKAAEPVTVTVSYTGGFNPSGTSVTSNKVTIWPSDSVKITSYTWSQSTGVMSVVATDNNPAVQMELLDNSNAFLGMMTSNGSGTFTFSATVSTPPSSVKTVSIIGGNTSAGVKKVQ